MWDKLKQRILACVFVAVAFMVVTVLDDPVSQQASFINDTTKERSNADTYIQAWTNVFDFYVSGTKIDDIVLTCNEINSMLNGSQVTKTYAGNSYLFSIVERWPSNKPFENLKLSKIKVLMVNISWVKYILNTERNTTVEAVENISTSDITSLIKSTCS